MFKLSLIATILVVFTVGSHAQAVSESEAPPIPLELFAEGLIESGKHFKCAAYSCDKGSIQKASELSCAVIKSVKALPEITAEALATIANTAVKGALAIEPKCIDSSYKGCEKYVPNQIKKCSKTAITTGRLLGCAQNPTEEDVKQAHGYFIQFANILKNSEAKGLECSNVINRGLKVLRQNIKQLCKQILAKM